MVLASSHNHTAQMKEQNKTSGKELNKMEMSNILDAAKFKTLVIRMFTELRRRVNELRENFKSIKKDMKTIKKRTGSDYEGYTN